MFRHLLVPTDGSPLALDAARLATALTVPGGEITLLHVHQEAELTALSGLDVAATIIGGAPGGWRIKRSLQLEQEGARVLAETRAVIVADRQVETLFALGRPADVALEYLERPDFDGAVFGSRGKGRLGGMLLGSVSDALLRHGTKPVVVARGSRLRSILVAIDGSEAALRAAKWAGDLARAHDSTVVLACAVAVPPGGNGGEDQEVEATVRRHADRVLADARAQLGAVEARDVVLRDEPAHGLLEEAGRMRPDLVILGRRGAAPSYRVTLGTVALRVAAHAEASVMLVP